jgi:alkyl hydroperoxide reductase subunit AhpF
MPLINQKDREALGKMAQAIKHDVDVTLYTQRTSPLIVPGVVPCETCESAEQLVSELGEILPGLKPAILDLVEHREQAAKEGVDRVPTIVMGGAAARRVRFVGFPSGYEAASFVQSVFEAGGATEELPGEVIEQLNVIEKRVDIKVFVTPT